MGLAPCSIRICLLKLKQPRLLAIIFKLVAE
jgi:hypothetical protein